MLGPHPLNAHLVTRRVNARCAMAQVSLEPIVVIKIVIIDYEETINSA